MARARGNGGAVALRRALLAGVLSLVVAIGIGRFGFTPVLPVMQEDLGLTTTAAGTLASSNYLGYLVGAVLAAFVPAGRPRDVLLRTSLLLVAASTAAVALTTALPAWMVLRFLSGLAGAGIFVFASAAVLEELSLRGRMGLSGHFYSGVGLGIALSGLLVMPIDTFFEPALAWRTDWLLLGATATIFAVACWAWLPQSRLPGGSNRPIPGPESEEAKGTSNPVSTGLPLVVVLLCVAYFLDGGGYIVTGTFLPAIVERLPGLKGAGAGLWVLVGLAAAPSTVVWTRVASRLGSPPALVLAYVAQAVGIALPVFSDAWWAAAGSAALFGATVMGIVALTLTYAREVVDASKTGLAIGLLTALYGVGQVLGPLVAAALAGGPEGFGPALLAASAAVASGGMLMTAVALVDATRTRRKEKHSHDDKH